MSLARQVALLLVAMLLLAGPRIAVTDAQAQVGRDTERKLERIRKELKDVASERRKLEGQRGDAARQLRQSDEQVSVSVRSLRRTEADLASEQAALAALQARREALQGTLSAQREELRGLLRAAYTVGDEAPLKTMLAQDRVADAGRALAYHRYLQQHRMQRIATLRAELAEVETIERDIATRQAALEGAREAQRTKVATLERDRRARADTAAQLEKRYRDRSSREKALGRDAKSLERLLTRLRASAAKAEAERRKAAAGESAQGPASTRTTRKPVAVARTAPVQVGGLGWPLSGTLLAGYGGKMPDGRSSSGVLIGASAGTTVKAVGDGTVVFAEWMTGYGMILIVDHGNNYMSLYAHNEALLKEAGDAVKRGDAIATVGNSGGQGKPGLYFELRRNGQPVNPDTWLQKR